MVRASNLMTVQRLRKEVLRFRTSPTKAQTFLIEISCLVEGLLAADSDSKRISIFKKLKNRLTRYPRQLEDLLYYSKIASLPEQYWRADRAYLLELLAKKKAMKKKKISGITETDTETEIEFLYDDDDL